MLPRLWQRLFLFLAIATCAAAQSSPYRFSDVERVVAIGDVHGAHEALLGVLQTAGLIDGERRWIGGTTHLVSVGDLLDRGDDSRAVMDLLMRLQIEALAAGGKVHVVLGNHEIMNLTGDLAYVTTGEFSSYQDLAADPEGQSTPPGFAGHRAAFAPDGTYGRWLLGLPVAIVVNEVLYLHAGVTADVAGLSLEEINARAHEDLRKLMDARETLRSAGLIERSSDNGDVQQIALRLADDRTADEPSRLAAAAFLEAIDGIPFAPRGPVWNRRNAVCHPLYDQHIVEGVLAGLGARRLAVGHTPTAGRVIQSRFDGQVLLMDTGMNVDYYKGHPSALEMHGDDTRTYYTDLDLDAVKPLPQRTWERPYGLSDAEIEAFLREGEITIVEDLATGVTKPQRLTLRIGDREIRAVYKSVDSNPEARPERWSRSLDNSDRYIHDVVAYRLDRLLGLEMVPPAVTRVVNGREGVVQYWLERTINERDRRAEDIPYRGVCGLADQYNLMNIFDSLIHNDDRNLTNVLFTRMDWKLWLIDHSRAFRSSGTIPRYLRESPFEFTPQIIAMLESIDEASLSPLEDMLASRQIRAIVRRASALLKLAR